MIGVCQATQILASRPPPSLSGCLSVSRCWPPLLLLQAAALCARCRSRVLIDTHTLLSVCAYTTTHTLSTPITAAATQARPSHCHRCA